MRVNAVGRFLAVSVLSVSLCPAVVAVSDTLETVQTDEMEAKTGVQEKKAEGTRRRLPSILSEQDRDSENRARAFGRLKPGSRLRIHVAEKGRMIGRVKRISDRSVTLTGSDFTISLATIDTLWTRSNAAVGGGLAGALAAFLFREELRTIVRGECKDLFTEDYISGKCSDETLVYDIAFVLGGALAGGSIGQLIFGWQLSYYSPPSDQLSMKRPDEHGGSAGPARGLRLAISLPF